MTGERLNRSAVSHLPSALFFLHHPCPSFSYPRSIFPPVPWGDNTSGLHLGDSLAHWLQVKCGQWVALGGSWRAVGKWDQAVFPPLPSCFSAMSLTVVVFLHDYNSCQAGPYLQAPIFPGSITLFLSLGSRVVMASCCSQFLGVSLPWFSLWCQNIIL